MKVSLRKILRVKREGEDDQFTIVWQTILGVELRFSNLMGRRDEKRCDGGEKKKKIMEKAEGQNGIVSEKEYGQ